MTSRQWLLLELDIEAALQLAESASRIRAVRRLAVRIKRRWRQFELLELLQLDLGGES